MTIGLYPELATESHPDVQARRPLGGRLWRGREDDPRWVRPALLALLAGAALLYLVDLGASGWANSFYSAAVQAATNSWKAFFFGSSDAANSITVDKPPAALWVMDLSARIFGVNAWSILVPQALEGVATVGVLYATVRRWFSPAAGIVAGAVMALTPSAVLMFRYNNPDALLVLLMTLGAYATVRAIESGRTKWLVLVGALIGFGFLTKMLQALLVIPAFALAYLVAGPTTIGRRVRQLLLGGVAMVAAAGWWVAIVAAIPTADRPYIGGSQHNSILELIFGYNGFGRLTGNETGSVTGGGAGPGGQGAGGFSPWGATGWTRLFGSDMGTQVSWLLPAALILLVGVVWLSRHAPRTDRLRAAAIVWGGWLLVTGATFSLAQGIIHPYYTVALAPALGALVGIGTVTAWHHRDRFDARMFLAAAVLATGWWARELLTRTPTFHPWLQPLVLIAAIAVAVVVLVPHRAWRHLAAAVAATAAVATMAAPVAYALDTASTPHTGSLPSAGPVSSLGGGRGGGFAGGRPSNGARGGFAGQAPGGTAGGPQQGGGFAGGAPGQQGGGRLGGFAGRQGNPGGGPGGLLDSSTPSAAITAALRANAAAYTWVAAAIGSQTASGYQLATGDPVMPIGGFNGSDPSPTLAQFEQYVRDGRIHYFIASGIGASNGGSNGGSNDASTIAQWVESNFTATTIGGTTVYDLTGATGGTSGAVSGAASRSA